MFGTSITSIISSKLSQDIVSGILTAKIGVHAMNICRPIPFTGENQPSLASMKMEILMLFKDKSRESATDDDA